MTQNYKGKYIHGILQPETPDEMLEEVKIILNFIASGFNMSLIESAFDSTIDLFNGNYEGYMPCNTKYHDLTHTTGTFLAMARLTHGAVLDNQVFSQREISLALAAALFHDAGYIQENHDKEGTGAKYTDIHVMRSMEFLGRHGAEHGLSEDEIEAGRALILGTDILRDLSSVSFGSKRMELLARMLAVADIVSQMSDRIYLEKLLFLYQEFMECNSLDYKNEVDFLQKTIGFYDMISCRLGILLEKSDFYFSLHFGVRWKHRENLYLIAMEKNRTYLKKILEMQGDNPLIHLKRSGIVDQIAGN